MLSNEYLKTARALQRAALKMTDRLVARQLRALAEDYERRAEKAARADATAQEGLVFPEITLKRAIAGRTGSAAR